VRTAAINGQPGGPLLDPAGNPLVAITLDIADDASRRLGRCDPDKLRHLGTFGEGSDAPS
jgi:hypothetical protein